MIPLKKNNSKELLQEFRQIRGIPSYKKPRKRKSETYKKYHIRISRNRCEYCQRTFKDNDLKLTRRHPEETFSLFHDGVIACVNCYEQKGDMKHHEFLKVYREIRKIRRSKYSQLRKYLAPRVFKRYNYTCIYCTYEYGYMPKGSQLTVDHKVPISKGGTNEAKNLTCACEFHNFDKADRTATQYFAHIDVRKKKHQEKTQKRKIHM